MDKKREEKLRKICSNINKSFDSKENSGKIVTFIGDSDRIPLKRFSSGCAKLDDVLGGGWPLGRIAEIYGSEGSGKTTLCYHAMHEFQKSFPENEIAWIDSEYSFDPDYAEQIGVDVETMLFHQPDSGEQALETVRRLIGEGTKLIIVDSVAALTPRVEVEGEMADQQIGVQARLMSKAMRVLAGEAGRNDVLVLFTNQERVNIGVMYGSKNTTPGGRALRFYASIRLELRVLGSDKEKEVPVAIRVKSIAKKNKTAPPLRVANYTITFGYGIDNIAGLFDFALENKVIEKSGAWYNFGETKLGHGKGSALELMRNDPSILEEIKAKIQEEKEDDKDIKVKVAKRGRPPKNKEPKTEEKTEEKPEEKPEEDISIEDV